MNFAETVRAAFTDGGALSRSVNFYKPRQGQLEMADAVARTMDRGGVLVVEAGTGVGKTFAYLIPALLSGERVLISTATKALQDQLFLRDIPFLKSVTGGPVSVALLKGRSSYLCPYRLEMARQDNNIADDRAVSQLSRVELWAMQTRSGDLAEVDALDEASSIIPAITSSRENCLGSRCPRLGGCFVNQARREAMAADLVVVNHHLFFADLNVRESGVAELLPSVRCVIFDEAHQLNETGVQFLGKQWSTGQLESFSSDLQKLANAQARGFADWTGIGADLNRAADALHAYFHATSFAKQSWADSGLEVGRGAQLLQSIGLALEHSIVALAQIAEISPEFSALQTRGQALLDTLKTFIQTAPLDSVRWIDVGHQVRLVQSPLDISASMQSRVLQAAADPLSRKSWIFTSATLGADAGLTWFVDACGLQGAEVLRVDSPFDYATQASLYIPATFRRPDDVGHSAAVAELVAEAALVLGGRTMVLTTTLRAMRAIADQLRVTLQGRDDLTVLVQGQHPKRMLVDLFTSQRGAANADAGVVLVASVSFWEGIDIPGDALQLLVIDKLPFAPPDDPVQVARAADLESRGQSAFKHLYLPHAAVALKQGAGRLIRRETDQGVLIICDVRMARMGYGKQLIKALPPMRRLLTHQSLMERLDALTRPSTRDRPLDAPP